MTKREKVLKLIEVAAYEGDQHTAIRLYVENRVSAKAFHEAMNKGIAQRRKW